MQNASGSLFTPHMSGAGHRIKVKTPVHLEGATKGVEVVYYIRLKSGAIKIGTSANFTQRARKYGVSLNRGSDRVLAIELGGRDLERQRHEEFSTIRIGKSEHFLARPVLMQHIKRLREVLGVNA
jgi:hypothetical protein